MCVMLRKIEMPSNNVETSVEFVLRGAKKRRSMAMANAITRYNGHNIKNRISARKKPIIGFMALLYIELYPFINHKNGSRNFLDNTPHSKLSSAYFLPLNPIFTLSSLGIAAILLIASAT